jgi:hypothetical protein
MERAMPKDDDASPGCVTRSPDRSQLAREAYRIADRHRDGLVSRTAALQELARRCPGFSDAEYRDAFARGLLESR